MLTEADIRFIRAAFAEWKAAQRISPSQLAHVFGLSRESIYRIARRDVYAWVSDSDVDKLHGDSASETCESCGNTLRSNTHGQK